MNYEEFIIKSDFAREAFTQAEIALDRGDRPVGAIIEHNGKIVSRGSDTSITNYNCMNHAVINAICKIPDYLMRYGPDCTIYTTYEPCLMCKGAIKNFKIENIFCMSGVQQPRSEFLTFRNYQRGLSEEWSFRLFKNFYETYMPDGLPLPPPHLRFKVIANKDPNDFLKAHEIIKNFNHILIKNGKSLNELTTVLDLGCGCGRVTRHWSKFKNTKIYGSDYNPELINWCKNNLTFGSFNINNLEPPLEYPDNMFEFIYMTSVFTHWSEPLQLKWIKELRRIMLPGGFLYFSTHGNGYINQLDPQQLNLFNSNKLVVKNTFVEGSNDCASFQTFEHVKNNLSPGFEILEFIPGDPGVKDQYLFKKL